MNPDKQKRLEQAGWTVGDYGDVFSLTPEDRAAVENLLAAGITTGSLPASGSFRGGLNHGTGREVSENEGEKPIKSHGTPLGTIHETRKSRPGISRAELIALVGRSRSTVARAVAELIGAGVVERRGSKKMGGYFSKST